MMPTATLQTCLEAMVGPHRVWVDEPQTAAFAIAPCTPRIVVQPETVAQAADIVALAGRERLALVPWGQGTQMHLGQVPQRYDLALSLAALTRIIEYDAANLTVTAEAGLALREVYKLSVAERQFLPLGFPGAMTSLGGALVTNTSGVKRARYGAVRDLLLGVRVALPEGALVHFGGRVVKNVAGYDMNKLYIGSLGVFGVVLETTYRLAALPEDDRGVLVAFPTLAQAMAAVTAIHGSPLLPSALLLCNLPAATASTALRRLALQADQVALLMNFDGIHEAVARQIRASQTLCQQYGGLATAVLTGEELLGVWEFQHYWCHSAAVTEPLLQVRLGVGSSHLETALECLTVPPPFAARPAGWLADACSGQLWLHLPLATPGTGELVQDIGVWLQQLRHQARACQGYCVLEQAPAGLRQWLDVWGETPGQQLLRRYKHQFDPHRVLNPGRSVAGL